MSIFELFRVHIFDSAEINVVLFLKPTTLFLSVLNCLRIGIPRYEILENNMFLNYNLTHCVYQRVTCNA